MNRDQQLFIFCGLLTVGILCMRPPYQWEHTTYLINRDSRVPHMAGAYTENIGHCWIWRPPTGWEGALSPKERSSHVASVDWPRLGIYTGLTIAITLFCALILLNERFGYKLPLKE